MPNSTKSKHLVPESAIVIDDDPDILELTSSLIKSLGVKRVDTFSNGTHAWQAMEQFRYGMVFLDWRLTGFSGLNIFNRIRSSSSYYSVPVLVISGFLKTEDFHLISEYSCSSLLTKPFTEPALEHAINRLMIESKWFAENEEVIEALLKDLSADPVAALKEITRIANKAPNPLGMLVEASYVLRKEKFLKEAESLLRTALESNRNSLRALTELGKTLHLQKRHKDAYRILKTAQGITPQSIERLLLLGEIDLGHLQPEEAHKHFEQALTFDPQNEKAKTGILSANNLEAYIKEHGISGIPKSLASLMNTIGISMVRSGKIGEGLAQYQAALTYVDDVQVSARIYFNLGLAHKRAGSPEKAIPYFEKSVSLGGSSFEKARSYLPNWTTPIASGSEALQPAQNPAIDYMEEPVFEKSEATAANAPQIKSLKRA